MNSLNGMQYIMPIPTKIKYFTLLTHIHSAIFLNIKQFTIDKQYDKRENTVCRNNKHITTVENDIAYEDYVQKQYKMLPYPPVTNAQLLYEEKFYKTTATHKLAQITLIDNDLETINHFLFQGKENFRYSLFSIKINRIYKL